MIVWGFTLLMVLASWALVWVVDKSCEFVIILGKDTNGTVVEEIKRGTQQGMWLPDDSCRPWRKYDNLDLDTKMIVTRVSAALSIVLGAFCLLFVLLWIKWTWRWMKWTGIFFCVCISVFQALTHLMVKSEFCEEAEPFTALSSGKLVRFDECDKSTPAYNITFATMASWLVCAILFWFLPAKTDEATSGNNSEDDQSEKNAELATIEDGRKADEDRSPDQEE